MAFSPAKIMKPADIQYFFGHAIGHVPVPFGAFETHHMLYQVGRFFDGDVRSDAHIDEDIFSFIVLCGVKIFHQEQYGIRQIIHIEE